jgi:hypothetical protein
VKPGRGLPHQIPTSEANRTEIDSVGVSKPQLKVPEKSPEPVPVAPEQITRKINLVKNREEEPPNAPLIHLADALPGAVAIKTENGSGLAVVRGEPVSSSTSIERVVPATGHWSIFISR